MYAYVHIFIVGILIHHSYGKSHLILSEISIISMDKDESKQSLSPTIIDKFLPADVDAIGDTVYSKQWLISCLIKTVQVGIYLL